jgi:prolyl-tRNA synthetase
MRPGDKFYWWEKRGTPVRIELGPKDIAGEQVVAVRRDTGEKMTISWNGLESEIESLLETIQTQMFEKAKTRLTENTVTVDSWEDFVKSIEEGKFVLAHWDGTPETEKLIKTELNVTTRCIPFDVKQEEGICVKTGKPSKGRIMFARSY